MKIQNHFWIFVATFLILSSFTSIIASEPIKYRLMTGEFQGRVTDSVTGKPLMGANVFIEHTTVGATANANGEYRIPMVALGKQHVVASMIGYKMENKKVNVSPGETTVVDFILKPTILEMGAIVVTGTGTPHIYEDNPVRTSVIPRRLIEQKQSVNLADALDFTTGVRIENDCQNCNFSQVRILGLDGKYSQILIDGNPVVSSLAGVYGLEQIPEEMIDQIEVVKGGGSSLYGGGSVAGVINLRTRRPATNQIRLRYVGYSTEGKMDHQIGATAEFINTTGNSGGFVFGSARQRTPYDYNDDGYSELGELKNESLGFNWYLKLLETGEFHVHLHRIHEQRRGGNKFHLPYHEAQISEVLEHWRWGGTFRWNHRSSPLFDYRLYYSFALSKRKSYYGGLGTETPTAEDSAIALSAYGTTDNPLHIGGTQMNYRVGSQLLTIGFQYSRDEIDDKATSNPLYYINNTYTNFGFFLQDNLHFGKNKQIEFVIGTRVDKHSEIDDWTISPRINGKFQLGRGFVLRTAYTTGFKPPQTYDEDLHLCGIAGDQRITRNGDDLKPEKSHSFSAGFEFQNVVGKIPTMLGVTGFYTSLKDAFAEEHVATTEEAEIWERINHGSAEVKGVEIDLGIRPFSSVEFRGGLTYKKSEYDEMMEEWGTTNFLRTPDLYGHLWISMDVTSGITLFAAGNYTGKADVPHEGEGVLKESDSSLEIDLGLTLCIPIITDVNGKLNVGVKNLTNAYQQDLDIGAERDPAYVYGPKRPRAIYAGFETMF
jgi:outer membrane receptor for ferrienterochelin and colicins